MRVRKPQSVEIQIRSQSSKLQERTAEISGTVGLREDTGSIAKRLAYALCALRDNLVLRTTLIDCGTSTIGVSVLVPVALRVATKPLTGPSARSTICALAEGEGAAGACGARAARFRWVARVVDARRVGRAAFGRACRCGASMVTGGNWDWALALLDGSIVSARQLTAPRYVARLNAAPNIPITLRPPSSLLWRPRWSRCIAGTWMTHRNAR